MRKHSSLANRQAIAWAETVAQNEDEALIADEVEAALDVELDSPSGQPGNGSAGAVRMKRASFEYGSVGRDGATFRQYATADPIAPRGDFGSAGTGSRRGCQDLGPENPSSPNMGDAIARHGLAGARRQVGNGVAAGRAHADTVLAKIGNVRRGTS